jgi:hypothetical protein
MQVVLAVGNALGHTDRLSMTCGAVNPRTTQQPERVAQLSP